MRNGLSGRAVGWSRFFDSNGPAGIVEFETDVGYIVARNDRLGIWWLYSSVLSVLGFFMAGVGVRHLRHTRSIGEIMREAELASPVVPSLGSGRERKRGAAQTAGGLLLIYSPLLYSITGSLAGSAGLLFGILPFVGVYFVVVGSHRLLFGRPMTTHDSPRRRITFIVLVALFVVTSFLALFAVLAFASFQARAR
jgi:hypothetical protein